MKKTNTAGIIAVALVSIFVIGGIYMISRSGGSATPAQGGASGDPMHGGAAGAGANPGSAKNLIGSPVPQFSLKDKNGTVYSSDSLKRKNVVLFFNEGLMCYPACWNQMVQLSKDSRFNNSDTVAFSVVIDQPADWQGAIRKMPDLANVTVLYDTDKSVSNQFGMLTVNSSMHYGSFPGHTFVVIDKDGIVRSVFDDPSMGIDNDRVFAMVQSGAAQPSN
jgi:peroxiredoxin Q/BCP